MGQSSAHLSFLKGRRYTGEGGRETGDGGSVRGQRTILDAQQASFVLLGNGKWNKETTWPKILISLSMYSIISLRPFAPTGFVRAHRWKDHVHDYFDASYTWNIMGRNTCRTEQLHETTTITTTITTAITPTSTTTSTTSPTPQPPPPYYPSFSFPFSLAPLVSHRIANH
ncbi:hypothetical protein E2C01_030226 [Portunus trituberculatus]|uniref:Uncharacterized protein n=1 Tax=Portunus trituberculatus TaxID=210409 RepID=A0A5B7EU49_PORTR|nr:hypothetical protein [Portunus trituberculatus]